MRRCGRVDFNVTEGKDGGMCIGETVALTPGNEDALWKISDTTPSPATSGCHTRKASWFGGVLRREKK